MTAPRGAAPDAAMPSSPEPAFAAMPSSPEPALSSSAPDAVPSSATRASPDPSVDSLPARDETWFDALYAASAVLLYRYFRRRLPSGGGGVGPDAEDLAAEVFATAWRRREDVPDGAEMPWLYRTAGFVLANHRRKARPVPVAEAPDEVDGLDVELAVVQDDEVRRVLAALSARDRRILLLHAWEGLGGEDLAQVLGISRGGADAALSRARSRLRAAWATDGAGDGESEATGTQEPPRR